MYDREKSDCLFPQEKAILSGESVSVEGALLVGEFEGGVEKVKLSAGGAAEKLVGFSTSTRLIVGQETRVAEYAVPSAGPYTVSLGFQNLVVGQIRVVIGGVALTVVGAAPAAGEVQVDYVTGLLTFNVAQAGLSAIVSFKRDLSVAESRELYREGFLHNARAFEVYEKVGVFQGKGVIYTDQYDVAADFSTGVLKTAANGLVTIGGAGADISAKVKVIELPGIGQPFLGLEFNI